MLLFVSSLQTARLLSGAELWYERAINGRTSERIPSGSSQAVKCSTVYLAIFFEEVSALLFQSGSCPETLLEILGMPILQYKLLGVVFLQYPACSRMYYKEIVAFLLEYHPLHSSKKRCQFWSLGRYLSFPFLRVHLLCLVQLEEFAYQQERHSAVSAHTTCHLTVLQTSLLNGMNLSVKCCIKLQSATVWFTIALSSFMGEEKFLPCILWLHHDSIVLEIAANAAAPCPTSFLNWKPHTTFGKLLHCANANAIQLSNTVIGIHDSSQLWKLAKDLFSSKCYRLLFTCSTTITTVFANYLKQINYFRFVWYL